jgi:hypothetical protein
MATAESIIASKLFLSLFCIVASLQWGIFCLAALPFSRQGGDYRPSYSRSMQFSHLGQIGLAPSGIASVLS